MGRDGRDGRDCYQECTLIFFILRYNKHYTHIYFYIYIKKLSRQISCGFKILDKLGVRIKKIKNTLLVGFFENQSKSRLFIKDFPCQIEGEFDGMGRGVFYICFVVFYGISFIKFKWFKCCPFPYLMSLVT